MVRNLAIVQVPKEAKKEGKVNVVERRILTATTVMAEGILWNLHMVLSHDMD